MIIDVWLGGDRPLKIKNPNESKNRGAGELKVATHICTLH